MASQLEKTKKQNDGMYNGLVKNGVSFERKTAPETDDEDVLLKFYQDEQAELKQSLIEFRKNQPKPEQKPKKVAPPPSPKKEEEVEVLVEKKPNHKTVANMEEMKRAFFNDEIDSFLKLAKDEPYLFFEAEYKYNEDLNEKADFIARNSVKGFIANLDDKRKYFMNCFRCYSHNDGKNYTCPSLWIVNTETNLKEVTEDFSDDFEFTKVEGNDIDQFLQKFKKSKDEDNLIVEAYLH